MSKIPNLIVMIRPASFGFNTQTAESNFFQHNISLLNVASTAKEEFDKMVEKLLTRGIEVKVFEDIEKDLPDAVFSNNWMAQLPEGIITVFPMFTENRRKEIRSDIIEWIKANTASSTVIDLQKHVLENKYLEGTGSIVFDYRNKLAYACESPRTDLLLFDSFCNQIGYESISFQSHDLKGNLIYHTNVMLTLCNDFALVCFDSISNPIERLMLEKKLITTHHEVISISFEQMNQFAGNCIEVVNNKGKSFLLMSSAAEASLTELQKRKIEKHAEICSFEIPTIEKIGGGSVRCMITGLFKPLT